MKNLMILMLLVSGLATANEHGARPGSQADNRSSIPEQPSGASVENFDDILTLTGWVFDNQSDSPNSDWFQGNDGVFASHAGAPDSYIAANFNSTAGSVICNYMILPDLGFLQSLTFWTRTVTGNIFPDRMFVLRSPSGGINTGDCVNGFGDFTETLLELNPNLASGGYPDDWAEQIVPINGDGRIAFVYWVTDAGPVGNNSNYIGVDSMSWVAGPPPPPPMVPSTTFYGLLILMLACLVLVRRKFSA